jgi:hypothetical protein
MFRTIRLLTIQFIPKTGRFKGKARELITEKDKNFERWKQYIARPYKVNEQSENFTDFTYKEEMWILESKVRRALDQLPYNKALGCDNTKIKILKAIK